MAVSWTEGVRREVLPNGLTLLVKRDRSAPVVAVVTHVRAGFFDEPDRWQGVSHVLEHMFFKGTPRRGPGEIARETKALGGYLNASTSYDHTSYFVVLPAERLAAAMDVQADALRNSLVDADELSRELKVIIEEAKRKLDSPAAVAYETLHEVMFDRHRIRRWRIGTEDQLAGYTRPDVAGYYRSRYVPSATIVAIVGDVDEDEALAAARRAYGDWEPGPAERDPSPAEPPRHEVRTRTLRGDVTRAELVLGWRAVPPLDPDAPALDLAAAVLAMGRGSALYRVLREPGIATSASAHFYAPSELGVFLIAAELEAERVPEALQRIASEVARLRIDGPSADELERARTLLLARWARQMESMQGRASALAAAEALSDVGFLDREHAAIASLDADAVRAAAARHLLPDSVSGVAYLPASDGEELAAPTLARVFREAATSAAPARAPHGPGAAPPRRVTLLAREAQVHHAALPGADILVRRKSGVPTVTLGVYLRRTGDDPAAQAGITALAARAAVRGAGDLDARGLAFAFERLGGTLVPSVSADAIGFGTTVLADRLPEAVRLLHLVLTEPRHAEADLLTERALLLRDARHIADDMFRYPFQLAFAAGFGDHAYGVPVHGLPETIPALEPDAVRKWHRGLVTGGRLAVVAVGDLDPASAAEALAGAVNGHPTAGSAAALAPVPWAVTDGPVERVVRRQKAQSAIAMAFPGPSRGDDARYAAEVWAAVASGLGGRLFEALRDRRSLAYTVLAMGWQRARAGALVTYIATSPDREAEARREMGVELERFAEELVTDTELVQAVNYLAGQAEVQRQSASAVAGEILDAWLAGGDLSELADPAAPYRAVTAAAVREIAERSLDPRLRAEGVVRGTAPAD
jgi:zinc protease